MGKTTGFMEFQRTAAPYRDPALRIADFDEIYTDHDESRLAAQSARCMDCGVPFCQSQSTPDNRMSKAGCPIHNLIPEWNDLVYRNHWRDALDRLHATNNFPEFTGRVCPAPCEGSCVLGITDPPVTIKNIEMAIVDKGFARGWISAQPPLRRTNKSIAIVGSGPAGLAAAAQLNSQGHTVTVYERADRIGGLLMYGIPNMKLEKQRVVERRLSLMKDEGVRFVPNADIGDGSNGSHDVRELVAQNDAVLLATGATVPNDLAIPGRELKGIHFAMEYLTLNTKSLLDSNHADGNFINAANERVLVIGGGDTGTDCLGTAMRHGCKNLVNFELFPSHPPERRASNPWPEYPNIFRVDYGHEEAAKKFGADPRKFAISTTEFIDDGNGRVAGVKTLDISMETGSPQPIEGTEQVWEFDRVFLALGFRGPEHGVSAPLDIELDARSNYLADKGRYQTSVEGVFAAGDCRRGQSLVVWAINEGREAAREIDCFLMNSTMLVG
ncbi:MAG: glutamate synthase subunit beta [Gammaproteobacteria bacterium]|nr:glutamate synthase subunit beta [Gammaproteobacteria bacterium]